MELKGIEAYNFKIHILPTTRLYIELILYANMYMSILDLSEVYCFLYPESRTKPSGALRGPELLILN